MICLLGCNHTMSAHVQLVIHQHPQVPFPLYHLIPQSVLTGLCSHMKYSSKAVWGRCTNSVTFSFNPCLLPFDMKLQVRRKGVFFVCLFFNVEGKICKYLCCAMHQYFLFQNTCFIYNYLQQGTTGFLERKRLSAILLCCYELSEYTLKHCIFLL